MKKINKFLFLLLIFVLTPITWLSAESFSYIGCSEISRLDNTISLRMKDLQATINITDASNTVYFFNISNIDPDFVVVDNYNEDSLVKTDNALSFSLTVADSATINIAPWQEINDNFYFVAMSDPQIRNDDTHSSNITFSEILEEVNIINPYFSTISGDLIHGSDNDQDLQQEEFANYISYLDNISSPYFHAPGNHDWWEGLDDYESYFGDYNYSFDFGDAHFTFTSSVNDRDQGYWSSETTSWLESDLSSTNMTRKLVFFHHALVPPTWYDSYTYDDVSNRNEVAGILDDNSVDFIITGHNHGYDFNYIDSNDIYGINNGFYQLITGGAGGELADDDQYNHFNMMLVRLDGVDSEMTATDEFPLDKDELNANDGSEESSAITLYNDSVEDWDWARLKYKISPEVENIYAVDSEGNYLEFNDYLFNDYRVIYVTTDVAAESDKTITVNKSTKIHQGVTNTIYADGEVTYSSMPKNTTTEISLEADLSKDQSTITTSDWQNEDSYYRKWTERANQKSIDTTYTISDLPESYRYQLKVNDDLFGWYYPDANGEVKWEYDKNKKKRLFELEQANTLWPQDIAVVPASGGGPQVRTFNSDGSVASQFFAYSQNWQGGYKAFFADVDGDREQEIITVPEAGLKPKLKVFNSSGDLLASKNVFKSTYKKGVIVKAGDIDADGKDEIIISSPAGKYGNKIKIYKYYNKKGKLKLKAAKRVYNKDFTGGVNLEIANVNNSAKEEIIVAPYTEQKKVKVYKYKNSKLKLLAKKNVYGNADYSGISLAVGDVNKKGRAEIITAPRQGGDNLLKIYRLKKNNNFKFVKKKKVFKENYTGGLNVVSGDMKHNFKDEIIIAPISGQSYVKIYKYDKHHKIRLVKKKQPYGSGYKNGINIALADIDGNWDLELITAPQSNSSHIKVYDYTDSTVKLNSSFWGYAQSFTGGINIINNL